MADLHDVPRANAETTINVTRQLRVRRSNKAWLWKRKVTVKDNERGVWAEGAAVLNE